MIDNTNCALSQTAVFLFDAAARDTIDGISRIPQNAGDIAIMVLVDDYLTYTLQSHDNGISLLCGDCLVFCQNMDKLYEKYDTFLIDMYGVLWNGRNFFDGTLSLLKKMRMSGKKVFVLSNTTSTATQCCERYLSKGMVAGDHFDQFISSGEVLKNTISHCFTEAQTYFAAFAHFDDIFKDSGLSRVQFIEQSDFVFVGNINYKTPYFADDLKRRNGKSITIEELTSVDYRDIADFDEITSFIDMCLKYNKTLVIANSDLFAIEAWKSGARPVLCPGYIGSLYENAGGDVVYFGKPYPIIFDYAKQFISPNEKVAMIGDTPWTDILGGNLAGVDTILTLSGIASLFIKNNSESETSRFVNAISAKMVHTNMKTFSRTPTHIIDKFA